MLLLKHGRQRKSLRVPNTLAAVAALGDAKVLNRADCDFLKESYRFLRTVECRLRIYHNRSLDELPESADDLEKLAKRMGCEATNEQTAGQIFLRELERHTSRTRQLFKELFGRERTGGTA